jgi:hypothetical protein
MHNGVNVRDQPLQAFRVPNVAQNKIDGNVAHCRMVGHASGKYAQLGAFVGERVHDVTANETCGTGDRDQAAHRPAQASAGR